MSRCSLRLLTAHAPGAIAVIETRGDIDAVITRLTGASPGAVGSISLASFADVDEGLVIRIAKDHAYLMPHGGVQVLSRLFEELAMLGARRDDVGAPEPAVSFPEALDEVEAIMLETSALAASPMAINVLLDQPRRWRHSSAIDDADRTRSRRLNHLLVPPIVVVAGPPNVGKSTLSNRLLGREMSIAADIPGTTRDYTAAFINMGGLVVQWIDTPGLREETDTIEAESIALATSIIARADLLISLNDCTSPWADLPRTPDLRVANKCDLFRGEQGSCSDALMAISAATGEGIEQFVRAVREALVSDADLIHPGRWLFDTRLELPMKALTKTVTAP